MILKIYILKTHLRSPFTFNDWCEQDVRRRIAIAKSAFTILDKTLKNSSVNIPLRYTFLKCYVWSTLLYGAVAWTLSVDLLKKLDAEDYVVSKNDVKDRIYGTCHKWRGPSQIEHKQKASEWNWVQTGEVIWTCNAKIWSRIHGDDRPCRRKESSRTEKGNLSGVPEQDEGKVLTLFIL